MFIPSNFCIMFGFTNVTLTTRIIPFIDNTQFIIVFSFKGNKYRIFLVFQVITILKLLLVNLWNFFKKCFWFNFIQFTVRYFHKYERFCNFKQSRWNYKTFISTFFALYRNFPYRNFHNYEHYKDMQPDSNQPARLYGTAKTHKFETLEDM